MRKIALLLLAVATIRGETAKRQSVCDSRILDIPVAGFTPLHLRDVTFCRKSAMGNWIGEFSAIREPTEGQYLDSKITLHISMKTNDGREVRFNSTQVGDASSFLVYSRDLYKPEEIASFSITADTD